MGLLYSVYVEFFTDSAMTNLVYSGAGTVGVAVKNSVPEENGLIILHAMPPDDYFTSCLVPGESGYLGGPSVYRRGWTGEGQHPSDWFPLAQEIDWDNSPLEAYSSYQMKVTFSSGYYVTCAQHLTFSSVYDPDGNLVQNIYSNPFVLGTVNGFSMAVALVTDSIVDDQIVGDLDSFNLSAAYTGSPRNWYQTLGYTTGGAYNGWRDFLNEHGMANADPYYNGGVSGTGGGTGTFDGVGDDIDIPSLPTLSAIDTGLIGVFNPSIYELKALASYMWGTLDITQWKKLFADPMDSILGLSIVPVAVPDGGSTEIIVGNIGTGIYMNKAASQYVEVDCGTIRVNEYWGSYLDYDPYTRAEIYLPYIGTHPVAVNDIMGKAIHVVYHVDIISGACVAYVKCGGSVLYSFTGQCASSIPVTGGDWTNVINGVLQIAASIGTMVATAGASAPVSAGAIAGAALSATSGMVAAMQPNIEKSGSMGGAGGMLAVQTPYLILTRPRQCLPAGQNAYQGYPSFITTSLSRLSGYTVVESVHLEDIPATAAELDEIESILKGGVIL